MMITKHTEVFCAQNGMPLNFSPIETYDYDSLLNKEETYRNTYEHMYNLCTQEEGVIAGDTSVLTVRIQFELGKHRHESTYKAHNRS